MNKSILLLLFACILAAVSTFDDDETEWSNFKKKYYQGLQARPDELQRKQIFLSRLVKVREHNSRFENGQESYSMEINKFADRSEIELNLLNGFKSSILAKSKLEDVKAATVSATTKKTTAKKTTQKPDFEFEWISRGAVNPVRNQGSCGSCWSFSAIGALEGAWFIKYGKLLKLSHQHFIDCSYSNQGCKGGFMDLGWVNLRDGIMNSTSYPYVGTQQTCKQISSKFVANLTGIRYVTRGDEDALVYAIKTKGPIAMAMYASDNLYSYKGGLFYDVECMKGYEENHALVAVGYGRQNGLDYFLIRNSWGADWGENGNFKLLRNNDNHCGVANYGQYTIV